MVAAAFEVEHSTSIYSGIVRMLDLALSSENLHLSTALFLVAPDAREADVRAQLRRPAFSRIGDLDISYLPYSELERHQTRSEEHTSELQSLMRISYAVFCLKKTNIKQTLKIYKTGKNSNNQSTN